MRYALITPARNEADNIEHTLRSMVSQTVLPVKWVIVSDGSTDGTDEIVKKYMVDHSWIALVRMPEHRDRTFAAKVNCFKEGFKQLDGMEYDVVGNLDGDISFDPDYIEFLLDKFSANPRLGVAGTPFVEKGTGSYDYNFTNIEHVSGACQLFRRECFQEIGGYIPIKGGGIDWTAVTTARMKGWETRTFTEKTCLHHRPMGTAESNRVSAFFKHGRKDYFLGGHPIWQIFRSIFQMKSRPIVFGGVALMAGYAWAAVTGVKRPISPELVRFHRQEQMARFKTIIKRTLHLA